MLPGFSLGLQGHQECQGSRECQECQVNQVNPVSPVNPASKVLREKEELLVIQATHRPLCPMEVMQTWSTQSLEEMLLKKRKIMYS